MLMDYLTSFLDWPFWSQVSLVAGAIGSVLLVAKTIRDLLYRAPKDDEAARREIRHLLESGPPRRYFSTYRSRLRKHSATQIRVMLREFGAVETRSRLTRAELWGLKRRSPQ